MGVTILLVSGVLNWDECLANKSAWNTFTWFAAVIAFASQLKTLGFVGIFAPPSLIKAAICNLVSSNGGKTPSVSEWSMVAIR